jgi:peptidoglycan hydrolase-like protein with peptidoglycan-binding domain
MQRIQRHLVSSTLLAGIFASGLAFADGDTSSQTRPAQESSGKASADAKMGAKAEVKASTSTTPAPTPAADLSGYSVEQIKELQRQLAARGAYQGRVDGISGPMTVAALRNFQIQQKLDTSGGLNADTRDALGLDWDRRPVSGRDDGVGTSQIDTTQQSPALQANVGTPTTPSMQLRSLDSQSAKGMQQRLRELGYYKGEIDGVLGEQTRSALQSFFQDQANLAARGVVNQATVSWFNGAAPASEPSTQAVPPNQ